MQLTLDQGNTKYQITKYSAGCVTINDEHYTSAIMLMPEFIAPWNVTDITQLQEQDLLAAIELRPDVILVGTGDISVFLDATLMQIATTHNIGIEVMSTAAACRTFTVLAAEGRKVLALLVI